MVTFRNNNRRNNFRRNDRNYKSNGDRGKYATNFSNNSDSFQRKIPSRNNHNAPKLIEKYNNLAREALSNGDKILSENYFQHADHFTRILYEQESIRKNKQLDSSKTNLDKNEIKNNDKEIKSFSEKDKTDKVQSEIS